MKGQQAHPGEARGVHRRDLLKAGLTAGGLQRCGWIVRPMTGV